jgi:hypothetical protein
VETRKRSRKTSFVPRIVFRATALGPAVVPVCVAAGVASLEVACVAEQGFACNEIEDVEGGTFVLNREFFCPPDASPDAHGRRDAAHDAGSDAKDRGDVDARDGNLLDAPDGRDSDSPSDAPDGHGG